MGHSGSSASGRWARWAVLAILALIATVLPLVLQGLPDTLVRQTYGPAYRPFELFGFTGSVFIILTALLSLRRLKPRSIEAWATTIAATVVAFYVLSVISEYSLPSYDYNCYVGGAEALLSGASPYTGCYIYPPLLAQSLAVLYRTVSYGAALLAAPLEPAAVWAIVFYLYRCFQFYAVLAAFWMSVRLMVRFGVRRSWTAAIVALLFLVNTPLTRTLRHNQINIVVLDCLLAAMLLLEKWPILAGIFVSLGGGLKLYPLLFGLPWLVSRKWRALAGIAAGLLGLVILQTRGLTTFGVWEQFLRYLPDLQRGSALRDNSIHSVVYNAARVAGVQAPAVVEAVVLVLTSLIGGYFLFRFVQRLWLARRAASGAPDAPSLVFAGMADALGLMLLISPMVWEHHYVLALPLSLWVIATQGRRHPWGVLAANVLIYYIPTFDLFPFSYNRLLGLILLLVYAAPSLSPRGPALDGELPSEEVPGPPREGAGEPPGTAVPGPPGR